jgi:hypothetical protein
MQTYWGMLQQRLADGEAHDVDGGDAARLRHLLSTDAPRAKLRDIPLRSAIDVLRALTPQWMDRKKPGEQVWATADYSAMSYALRHLAPVRAAMLTGAGDDARRRFHVETLNEIRNSLCHFRPVGPARRAKMIDKVVALLRACGEPRVGEPQLLEIEALKAQDPFPGDEEAQREFKQRIEHAYLALGAVVDEGTAEIRRALSGLDARTGRLETAVGSGFAALGQSQAEVSAGIQAVLRKSRSAAMA